MKEGVPIAVTVSRQMGSGGAYLGYLAAKELGFRDGRRAAHYRDYPPEMERISEKSETARKAGKAQKTGHR